LAYTGSCHCGFEWDTEKERTNREKHVLTFEEVTELFTGGTDYLELYDQAHAIEEERFIAIGPIARGIIVVVYTERQEDVIRIISARMASKREASLFWEFRGDRG